MSLDPALRELAGRLCAKAGLAAPVSATPLAGGKNNRVVRLDLADGPPVVLKRYHVDPRDTRDRLGAEWAFLTYLRDRRVATVPSPLAADREGASALYSLAPGRKLAPREVDEDAVEQAATFIVAANAAPRELGRLAPGSEACFSLADHLATVDRRVARLATLDPEAPGRERAEAWVRDGLVPAWTEVRARVAAEPATQAALPLDAQCASPSDFGFHNALADEAGRLCFIDFEYAGRDDPAKLVSDFFCCPEIPVPVRHHAGFVGDLADRLGLDEAFGRRCELLLDVYRIKWACIVMNEFLPLGAARRDFAAAADRQTRCAAQLDKAAAKLAEIGQR